MVFLNNLAPHFPDFSSKMAERQFIVNEAVKQLFACSDSEGEYLPLKDDDWLSNNNESDVCSAVHDKYGMHNAPDFNPLPPDHPGVEVKMVLGELLKGADSRVLREGTRIGM